MKRSRRSYSCIAPQPHRCARRRGRHDPEKINSTRAIPTIPLTIPSSMRRSRERALARYEARDRPLSGGASAPKAEGVPRTLAMASAKRSPPAFVRDSISALKAPTIARLPIQEMPYSLAPRARKSRYRAGVIEVTSRSDHGSGNFDRRNEAGSAPSNLLPTERFRMRAEHYRWERKRPSNRPMRLPPASIRRDRPDERRGY